MLDFSETFFVTVFLLLSAASLVDFCLTFCLRGDEASSLAPTTRVRTVVVFFFFASATLFSPNLNKSACSRIVNTHYSVDGEVTQDVLQLC